MGLHQNRLRVSLVCSILHPRYGGPASVVDALERYLSTRADISIWGRVGKGEEEEVRTRYPHSRLFPARFPDRWFGCGGLHRRLLGEASGIDVLHAHMLWDYPTYVTWRVAKKRHIPFVVTPHGMLNDPWRRRGLHKRLYKHLILRRMCRDVSCMQALNERERDALKEFGVKCPIEVIPNGVDPVLLTMTRSRKHLEREFPELKGKRCLLFLGRLWKEKGLDLLLPAWAALREYHRDWTLILAGPDYRGYAAELEQHAKKVGSVLMVGMVAGSRKNALLAGADVFTLPSRSEGFSMALLEALASGLPAVYSRECNFPDAAQAGAGIETDHQVGALTEGLDRVLSMDDAKRIEMGYAGRKLVAGNYTWDVIADSLMNMYQRISNHHPGI